MLYSMSSRLIRVIGENPWQELRFGMEGSRRWVRKEGCVDISRTFILLILLTSLFVCMGCVQEQANGQSSLPPPPTVRRVPFDQQWVTFRDLGFELNPDVDKNVLERVRAYKTLEEKPYFDLYIELGRTIEKEPWTPLTDRVWNFDIEAIEDHGAYVDIIKNLGRISRGEIKFENVKDYVDVEERVAWVSFTLRGKAYKWNLKVEDDWADPELFTRVSQLPVTLKTKGRYTYFNTGGQDMVIGYETPESRDAIIKATRLKIEWLN